jgi:hypothetical protein
VKGIADQMVAGSTNKHSSDILAAMALLGGAVMMARCMSDADLSNELLHAAGKWAGDMLSNVTDEPA